MLAQSNLTAPKHSLLCYLDSISLRNTMLNDQHPTMTPHEQITGRQPNYEQQTRFAWGALASTPRINQEGFITSGHEIVAVVHTPPDGHGSYVVLRQGQTVPSVRGDLKPLHQWEHETGETDWNKLKAIYGPDGRIAHLVSGATEDFTMKNLMRALDKRTLSAATPESTRALQQDCQPFLGRLKDDGSFTPSNPREKRLGTLRKTALSQAGKAESGGNDTAEEVAVMGLDDPISLPEVPEGRYKQPRAHRRAEAPSPFYGSQRSDGLRRMRQTEQGPSGARGGDMDKNEAAPPICGLQLKQGLQGGFQHSLCHRVELLVPRHWCASWTESQQAKSW
jgi:hypothetical protein